jgi:hypothetical protein
MGGITKGGMTAKMDCRKLEILWIQYVDVGVGWKKEKNLDRTLLKDGHRVRGRLKQEQHGTVLDIDLTMFWSWDWFLFM